MKRLVVDASVAVKWVFAEEGAAEALVLLTDAELIAPELILCECANIIWKKVRRDEYSAAQGERAAAMIEEAPVGLHATERLFRGATQMSVRLDHPAYDCFYLVLAQAEGCPLVTADRRLAERVRAAALTGVEILTLPEAAAAVL